MSDGSTPTPPKSDAQRIWDGLHAAQASDERYRHARLSRALGLSALFALILCLILFFGLIICQ